jgi:hypothetical protein
LIIVTGPQLTDDDAGSIEDAASLLGGVPAFKVVIEWATATALYCLAGWEICPLAVADVTIAESFGLPVHHLSV